MELKLNIPDGCLDAYEVKVNKDTFKYQAKVNVWSLNSRDWFQNFKKLLQTNPFLDFLNVLLEFNLSP